MNKVLILYRNELYKIFRTVRMPILLAVLVLIVLFSALLPVYRPSGRMYSDYQAGIEQQEEMLRQWNAEFGMMGRNSDDAALLFAEAVTGAALEDFGVISEDTPEPAGRYYMAELLTVYHAARALQDPAAYEAPELSDPSQFRRLWGVFPYFAWPGADAAKVEALAGTALESGSLSAYATLRLELLEGLSALDPASLYETEAAFYRDLERSGTIPDEQLYAPGLVDRRIVAQATLEEHETALATDRDLEWTGGAPLIPSRRIVLTDQLAVMRYQFTEGEAMPGGYDPMFSFQDLPMGPGGENVISGWIFSLILIMLFVGIQAGGMISGEIESGSVKLLIIAPVRRWKMYLAKLLALWTLVVVLVLFVMAVQQLLMAVLGQPGDFGTLVYAFRGEVRTVSFRVRMLLEGAQAMVKLCFYGSLVMMLSAMFRKTALTVGLGLGLMLVDFFLTVLYYTQSWRYWFTVMPWVNLDLVGRRMPPVMAEGLVGSSEALMLRPYQHSLGFSVGYIAVFLGLFVWAGMSAFTKRDI